MIRIWMVTALASKTVIYPQFLVVTVMLMDRELSQQPQWCRKIDLTRGPVRKYLGLVRIVLFYEYECGDLVSFQMGYCTV